MGQTLSDKEDYFNRGRTVLPIQPAELGVADSDVRQGRNDEASGPGAVPVSRSDGIPIKESPVRRERLPMKLLDNADGAANTDFVV